MLRLSLATRCLNLPLKAAVRAAAEAGAQAVQFDAREELPPGSLGDTGRRQFLHELGERGLHIASFTFPSRHTFYDEDRLDARVAAVKAAMEFAYQLKSNVLTARVGRIPADATSKDYLTLKDVLSDIARHGNHVGVTLAITPTNDSPQALFDLFAAIKTGPLGLDFDPAGFVMAGHQPDPALRLLHASIVHVLVRDGLRDIDGTGIEVAVGRGEVDWTAVLALLTDTDYRGWLTAIRTQGPDIPGDATRALHFLRNIFF